MNQIFKTTILLAILTGILVAIGYGIGGRQGMYIAFGLAVLMNFSSYWFSDSIVLKMQKATPIDEKKHANIFENGVLVKPIC